MRPAVFLDRDDTLIANRDLPAPPPPATRGDLTDPLLVRAEPGAVEACAALRSAGFALVVVTNQGVVARGGLSVAGLDAVHDALVAAFTHPKHGVLLDAVLACPMHPSGRVEEWRGEHPWRKPAPGMLMASAHDLNLDLERSWLVGDAERDVAAGIAAGLAPARALRIGPGAPWPTLAAAAEHILGMCGARS